MSECWAKRLIDDKKARRKLCPGVRNRRLLDLVALCFAFYYDDGREPAKGVIRRIAAKGKYPRRRSLAYELEPSDIIGVLGPGCSERKAKEYIAVLRAIPLF